MFGGKFLCIYLTFTYTIHLYLLCLYIFENYSHFIDIVHVPSLIFHKACDSPLNF